MPRRTLHVLIAASAAAVALVIAGVVAGGMLPTPRPATSTPVAVAAVVQTTGTVYASPNGTASGSCTQSAPCTLPTAIAGAAPGATVLAGPGTYPELTVSSSRGTSAAPVKVTAAPGATPRLTRVTSNAPNVRWSGLTVTVTFLLNGAARNSALSKMTFDGGGLFVRSSNTTVSDSEFHGGDSLDGIQISAASDVVIERNIVHDYSQNRDNGLHADCVQVFDAADVTIRANTLMNCYNAGIILSVGRGDGIDGILIESNFIEGCLARTTDCNGGTAVDLREPTASGIVLRNNTILNGPTRLAALPGSSYDRNIIGYLADCAAPLTNSLVADWNRRVCKTPTALGARGNVERVVSVTDAATGDLRLTNPTQALTPPWGTLTPAPQDRLGATTNRRVAGAHSPGGLPTTSDGTVAAGPSDTTPPTVAITLPVTGSTLAGVVTLKASASDNDKVAGVSFFAGDRSIGPARESSPGVWTLQVSSDAAPAGSYAISARAVDLSGNSTTSKQVQITLR